MVTAQSPPVKNAPTDTVFLAMVNPVNNVIRAHHDLSVRLMVIDLKEANAPHTGTVRNAGTVLLMGIDPNVQIDHVMEIVRTALEARIEILHALKGLIVLLLIAPRMAIVEIEMVVRIAEATHAVVLRVLLAVSVRVMTGGNVPRMVIDRLDQNALEGQIDQTDLSAAEDMTAVTVLSAAEDMTAMHGLNAQTAPRIEIMTAPLLDIQEDRATGKNVLVLRNGSSPNKSYLPAGSVGFAPTTLILTSMMMSLMTCSIKAQGMNLRL